MLQATTELLPHGWAWVPLALGLLAYAVVMGWAFLMPHPRERLSRRMLNLLDTYHC